jgi:hypothetical protein
MRDLWWTKWHLQRFFPVVLHSFHIGYRSFKALYPYSFIIDTTQSVSRLVYRWQRWLHLLSVSKSEKLNDSIIHKSFLQGTFSLLLDSYLFIHSFLPSFIYSFIKCPYCDTSIPLSKRVPYRMQTSAPCYRFQDVLSSWKPFVAAYVFFHFFPPLLFSFLLSYNKVF